MKIIFDSEEQMNNFVNGLTYFCPNELGLVNTAEVDGDCNTDCHACWANAVEMEVTDENNI